VLKLGHNFETGSLPLIASEREQLRSLKNFDFPSVVVAHADAANAGRNHAVGSDDKHHQSNKIRRQRSSAEDAIRLHLGIFVVDRGHELLERQLTNQFATLET
jgi:hypothetical protein